MRNSVGFDWHPVTRELWFTDNGRDMLGDDVPNDELNVAPKAGLHFGFPFCHQGDVTDPEFGAQRACSTTEPPVQKLGAHVAAIGFTFYTGNMFPASYKNAAIIAQHGSWNRSTPSGYRVMVARTDGRRVTSYEPLVEGFLPEGATAPGGRGATKAATGRPVDVLQMPDGSILISDDRGNRLIRVSYRQSRHPRTQTRRHDPPLRRLRHAHRSPDRQPFTPRCCRCRIALGARASAGPHRSDDQRHRDSGRESHVESGRHGVLRQHGERHDLPRRAGRVASRTLDSGIRPPA